MEEKEQTPPNYEAQQDQEVIACPKTHPPPEPNQNNEKLDKNKVKKITLHNENKFGETRIKSILLHSTRRGKTKARVQWNNENDTTTCEDMESLTEHKEALSKYLEYLKIEKKRVFQDIQRKHKYLIDSITEN